MAVAAGAVVLVPSLAVLYSLVLRGRLDTAEAAPGDGDGSAVAARRGGAGRMGSGRAAAGLAVVTLVAGIGLLVFADPPWAHGLGVLALLACAVTVFALVSGPPAQT